MSNDVPQPRRPSSDHGSDHRHPDGWRISQDPGGAARLRRALNVAAMSAQRGALKRRRREARALLRRLRHVVWAATSAPATGFAHAGGMTVTGRSEMRRSSCETLPRRALTGP